MQISLHRITHLSLLFSLLLVSPSSTSAQPKTLTILHTNDIHASFVPHEAFWVKQTPRPLIGGFKELSFTVDSVRRSVPDAILLDAGDVMTGNPITELDYRGASGGALFEMMNLIGYDTWCIGNHDFDISQENLLKLSRIAHFPTLSANVVNGEGAFPVGNRPYTVIARAGLRIGVIGVTSQMLYNLVNQSSLTGIKVLSPIETVKRFVDTLKSAADIIVALTHQGFEDDSSLAANITGVDVVVGGHSHTRLDSPRVVNGIIIVQTGSNCENLGVLNLTVERHNVTAFKGRLIPLWARTERPATELTHFVDSVQSRIDEEYRAVVATLTKDWVRSNGGESNIGDFVAEAQRDAAGAEIAFMNTHGIRANVPAGPFTKRQLFEVLPFRNILAAFQLSGREIRSILQYFIDRKPAVQTSGIKCRWRKRPDGTGEIVSIEINGKPLSDTRMYVCAASDYLVGEAKRYLGVELRQVIYLKKTVFAAVEEEARKQKVITSTIENRIEEVK